MAEKGVKEQVLAMERLLYSRYFSLIQNKSDISKGQNSIF